MICPTGVQMTMKSDDVTVICCELDGLVKRHYEKADVFSYVAGYLYDLMHL